MTETRFAELHDLYFREVVLYCRRRTRPDLVDDAVADTFLTAWRRIEEVPEGSEALPWLYAVAYRAIGHQYRSFGRHRKLREKLSAADIRHMNDPGDLVVMGHESRQVLRALSQLRQSDQEVLRLSVWEELTAPEIATVLGISEAAAKKRATRAKAALVRAYERLDRDGMAATALERGAT